MLTAAFIAIRTGGGVTGLICGLAAGVAVTSCHYLLVTRANVKDVIAGVGLNMLALAATSFFERIVPSAEIVPTLSLTPGVVFAAACVPTLIACLTTPKPRLRLDTTGDSAFTARIF